MDELVALAQGVRIHAYAPYSGYAVGAAVEAMGQVFTGANVENASLGLTICAERVALGTAVAAGARKITRIAIVSTSSPPAPPCGACLQTIQEFCEDCEVILANEAGERRTLQLSDLVPLRFGRAQLGR